MHDAGEKLWQLPLEDDYVEAFNSPIADMANVGKTRFGGAITAALFLKEYVDTEKVCCSLDWPSGMEVAVLLVLPCS